MVTQEAIKKEKTRTSKMNNYVGKAIVRDNSLYVRENCVVFMYVLNLYMQQMKIILYVHLEIF